MITAQFNNDTDKGNGSADPQDNQPASTEMNNADTAPSQLTQTDTSPKITDPCYINTDPYPGIH